METGFCHEWEDKNLVPADSSGWELRKDKNGIQVFTRDHPNSGIKEFKAITRLEVNISRLVELINTVEKYPSWMANCKSAATHKVINDTTRIVYMTTAVPWPLSDRDVVFEFMIMRNTSDYFEAVLRSVPDAVPEKENLVRIRNSEGRWIFRKTERNGMEVTHQFYGDPEGNVPVWIINMFIVSGPFKTLTRLRELCLAPEEPN